ncbi:MULTISPECIES: NAD(P)-binding protein [unclassified Streptomyces]|uniref:potassium channel family protein n=1 Tax=unclassified Streptomyces TaxID=2593676 RepID=UPI000DBA5FFE|nr:MULTISPECIES: NAD(P)-binding protein [unclassified Streptomyces]MYT75486.1 potassium transporter TrkA [Streptomyces sp. SID8367]RAJ86891.1 Trk K+ transport system NAD-binding subunit [Streptomyces sp. PsTaAH-137]
MIVCGDDALAERLAAELRKLYGEQVTVVVPGAPGDIVGRVAPAARARASALLARMQSVLGRTPDQNEPAGPPRVQQAAVLDEQAFADAGVSEARALALVHDDDEINIRAALVARRLNPQLRLVIRLYNRSLGRHLSDLLDQAAALSTPGLAPGSVDNSTTVLSDADTAAPALAATAVAGTSKVVQADGLLLRAVERNPPGPGQVPAPGLATLALLSATTNDPAGSEGSDSDDGRDGPRLLPDDADVAAATGRGTVVLETITPAERTAQSWSSATRGMPLGSFFSRRLRWSLFGLTASVLGLAIATWATGDMHPLHAGYLTLLDLFAIDDPAIGEPTARKVLQLLTGLAGLLLLPVLLAAVLEALGTFRTSAALRRPPRGLSGHIVLLGLGKVGTRVLSRLGELDIPVVCVEADPEARGIPLARSMRVPTVIGDAASDGVLEAAKIHRAAALLALTSVDTTNLEAALSARSLKPDLRVVLRLYDDAFAAAVYRTLRAAHPRALTRSRSVSTLAAPSFASAMMGRQVLGAVPVERSVLLFAALEVAGHPQLEGRTIAESFRPGYWRVIALDATEPAERRPDLSAGPEDDESAPRPTGLVWNLHPGHVLDPRDRVVIAATRQGLAELLGRGHTPHRPPADRADQV